MSPTLHAQILTLKKYQAWRTGADARTMDEAGIVPAAVTSALDAVLEIAEKYLRDGLNESASFNDANCSECGKSAADGWALYCVACVEKFNSVNMPSDDDLSELMGRFVGYSGHIHDDAFVDCARALLTKYSKQVGKCSEQTSECSDVAGFEAGDMASAAAQGFRDGVASVKESLRLIEAEMKNE